MATGTWLAGHIPCSGMDDCHALLKTGGYFVTSMRMMYWLDNHECHFKDKVYELIAEGKFEMVFEKKFMRGLGVNGTGVVLFEQ